MPEMMSVVSAETHLMVVLLMEDFQGMTAQLSGVFVGMPCICNVLPSGYSRAKRKSRSARSAEEHGNSKMQQ